MKLRLYQDSLRLRLSADDVQQLQQTGIVSQATHFGPLDQLTCQLRSSTTATIIQAAFDASTIFIEVPSEQVEHWASGEQVGLSAEQPVDQTRFLKILIEKDFECLHQDANEPGVKYYPNPNQPAHVNR